MESRQFPTARKAMIDSQIHPMGVISESVLNAFGTVPRELFLPDSKRCAAYCDEDILLDSGRLMMEPSVLARLIQALSPKPNENALIIGAGAGYFAAVLSLMVETVLALELEPSFLQNAQSVWDSLGYCNIAGIHGRLQDGCPHHAPYDLILFNGAVCDVPSSIIDQLGTGGRLAAIVRQPQSRIGKACLYEKTGLDSVSKQILFDTGTPYLREFEPVKEFIF